MKKVVLPLLVALVLSGCAGMHKPTQPEGPLHRVNPARYYSDYTPPPAMPAAATSSAPAQSSFRTVRQGSNDE